MGEWRARIYSLFREQLTCCCDHHTMQWLNKWSSGNSFWVLHSSLGLNKSRSVIRKLRIFFFVFVLLVLLIDLSENPSILSWLCYQFNTLKRICNLFVVQYDLLKNPGVAFFQVYKFKICTKNSSTWVYVPPLFA